MTAGAKIALAVGILVLAGVALVLPSFAGRPSAPAPAPPETAKAYRLPPCPQSGTGTVSALDGVRATCLSDGKRIDVSRALAGHTTVVNLWATWCGPCRDELPVIDRYAHSKGAAPALLVQVDSDPAAGVAMLHDLGVHLPSVHDGQGVGPIRKALRTPATLPASYIVDDDGRVHFVRDPRVFSSVGQVRQAVRKYEAAS